jgi:uncharacterized membrane protein YhaH (DUF805 family)
MNLPVPPGPPAATAPGLLDEPMPPLRILFSFEGRIPRKTWWLWGVLALLLATVLASLLLGIAGFSEEVAAIIANAVIIWPGLAISVKRWHDRDKSGWWVLINLIPVIGFIWSLVENGGLRGTVGPNRFGEDLTGRV